MALRILTCAAVLLGTAGVTVWSMREQPVLQRQPVDAGPPVLATTSVSMTEAIRMVERKFRARVVRTETRQEGGHTIYVMRLLSESGHVWTVRVDAANGSIH